MWLAYLCTHSHPVNVTTAYLVTNIINRSLSPPSRHPTFIMLTPQLNSDNIIVDAGSPQLDLIGGTIASYQVFDHQWETLRNTRFLDWFLIQVYYFCFSSHIVQKEHSQLGFYDTPDNNPRQHHSWRRPEIFSLTNLRIPFFTGTR